VTAVAAPAAGETLVGRVRRLAGAQEGATGAPARSRFVGRPSGGRYREMEEAAR
jgi:hypothetical protein